jgi:hypothetical protein
VTTPRRATPSDADTTSPTFTSAPCICPRCHAPHVALVPGSGALRVLADGRCLLACLACVVQAMSDWAARAVRVDASGRETV